MLQSWTEDHAAAKGYPGLPEMVCCAPYMLRDCASGACKMGLLHTLISRLAILQCSASSNQLQVTSAIIACSPWVRILCPAQQHSRMSSGVRMAALSSQRVKNHTGLAKVLLAGHKCYVPAHSGRLMTLKPLCDGSEQSYSVDACEERDSASLAHLQVSTGLCIAGCGPRISIILSGCPRSTAIHAPRKPGSQCRWYGGSIPSIGNPAVNVGTAQH